MDKCYYCFFRSVFEEMGVRWDVCTLYDDLEESIRACVNSENCPNFINGYKARSIITNYVKGKSNYGNL